MARQMSYCGACGEEKYWSSQAEYSSWYHGHFSDEYIDDPVNGGSLVYIACTRTREPGIAQYVAPE